MPDNMRLHARTECPVEDTPPSTRPSSAASSSPSTSSTPHRSTSMDSLHTNSSTSDKPSGEELIPTRVVRAAPKSNSNALQFIKTGPANLHRSAREQMKKADIVKSLRKSSLQEEEEWQSNSNPKTPEDNSDWQENLDKWKSSRRKRNEDVLERVIEVKKYEQEEEYSKGRRKSKTFNEMREDTNRKGRRYNLVVHDDDNNDLSDLGLSSGGKLGSSLSDAAEDSEHKDMDNDNKDTKSDAGFCTGSDTGSDGVFPEDISDTSSALDDKKDAHDSLLDTTSSTTGLSNEAKNSMEPHGLNGHDTYASSSSTSKISSVASQSSEYTYDKAIEDYKQFAVNSVKKRSSSVTSLSSNASFSKEDEKVPHRSQGLSKKMDEKLSYFHRERDVPHKKEVYEPKIVRREKNLKVDINKRRSMFELRDIDNKVEKQKNRRSFDVGSKLKTKVLSFENIPDSDSRPRAITPQRDTKFKEKLASFSHFTKPNSSTTPVRKKTPERDENFYKKLQSFTRMESQINSKSVERNSDKFCKSSTERTQPDTHAARKLETRKTPDLKPTNSRNTEQSVSPLKDRICSFENLIPSEDSFRTREKSVSMECLAKNSLSEELKPIHASQSVTNIYRRTLSTPYMVVEVDEPVELEQTFVKENISRKCQMTSSKQEAASKIKYGSTESLEIKLNNNLSVFERPTELSRDLPPQVPPPKVPSSPTTDNSLSSRAKTRVSSSPLRLTSSAKTTSESTSSPPRVSASPTRRSPSPAERRIASSPIRNRASPSPVRVSLSSSPSRKPLSPPVTPPCTTEELQYSLVRDTSRKYSDVQNCSAEFELRNTEDYEDENEDDSCHLQEYGDDDIDEVIDNYERLSESVTGGVASAENEHVYEAASEMTTLMRTPMMRESCEDNVYEHIQDDDPLYENIYDKIQEPIEDEDEKSLEGDFCNHHYQTLDEVQTKVEKLPLPALPPKNSTLSFIEVLDVTWTDESASRALLPPSVPPPPPPTDDDDVEDGPKAERQLRLSSFSASSGIAKEDRKTKSNTSTKKEIRQKMSDFLGTQPHTEEEVELQPPPDVNEILRQQREAERLIVQKQQSLPRESPLLEFDTLVPQPYRSKYTWEDRMRDDSARPHDSDESGDHFEFHTKLAELELEMVKHDREILQRIKATEAAGDRMKELAVSDHIVPDSRVNLPTVADARIKGQTAAESRLQSLSQLEQTSRISNEETLFSSSSSCIPPPLQYEYVQSGQQIYHDKCLEETSSSVSPQSFNNHSGDSVVKLPLQEFYTAPTYNERSSHVLNTASCHENAFYEESKSIQSGHKLRSELNATTEPGPRKQSILALSAIPKPRLVDNDSWIMKKKTDVGKKDYNKHWLFHEAEQRRLEQQDCITRSRPPVTDPTAKFPSPMPSAPSYHSHFQNMKSNFSQSDNINYNQHISNGPSAYPNMSNVSPSPYCNHNSPTNIAKPPRSNLTNTTPVSNISSSHSSSSQSLSSNGSLSSTSNNNWKKQTKTYQPETLQQANSSKPLPDAIINTLTQRVNNKNKNNGSSKPSVYSTAYRDESYHDYMNTDFSTPSPNISPTLHQGTIPQQQQQQQQEEQRLLSVSGKKKCSHCGEELGRGAAMIIESLRLFYHIPCFKCCVCGIQLGNGTSGADVRVRNHKLHCHNCYSNDEGMKFSKV